MIQKLNHRHLFEPEVIKKVSPGKRIDFKSSLSQMCFKIAVFKNFANSTVVESVVPVLGLYLTKLQAKRPATLL